MINANAVDIRSNDSASRVEQLEVARLDGSRFTIESRTVVLAAGGIENPRLLLASDGVQRGGLGNQHDLVGRYFSDHPHLVAGHVVLTDPAPSLEVYRLRPPQPVAVLSVSEAVQRAERLLNLRVHLAPVPVEASELTRDVPGVASRIDGYGASTDAAGRGVRFRLLDVSCESTPNPSSRVRLSDERDALGMRRVVVDWQQDPRDHDSVARSVEIIGRTLGRESQGRVRVIPREAPWSHAWEGNHHLGTTRMHLDAKQGVVDEHCRVRGIANLYVAGSSVFPAFGFANPTFTIVALAIRLAEHLRSRAADA
jgi:choline dehydrogenase-like flavoprotein